MSATQSLTIHNNRSYFICSLFYNYTLENLCHQ